MAASHAPKNPFEARPTKVPRTEEAPSTSTNTTSVPDSIATINDRLLCDSANMKQPPPSSAETREKQSSASEKPATAGEKPCQPSDPKCFLDRGKSKKTKKVTLMQISKSANIFIFIWKEVSYMTSLFTTIQSQ